MHRSGTSSIACAVNQLGIYFGEPDDMMAPLAENPEGFWERHDLVYIHDTILHKLKREWDSAVPLPEQWHLSAEMRSDWIELKSLIKKEFIDHAYWGWKDPRSALLLDIWKDILKSLNIELNCIYVYRNPKDVANSLEIRDGFPHEKSYGLWVNYNLAAINATIDLPVAFLSYESFLQDCESELKRCADKLNIPWPEQDSDLKKMLKRLIRPDLCHSSCDKNELEDRSVPWPAIKLYRLIDKDANRVKGPDDSFYSDLDYLTQEFLSYAQLFRKTADELWDCKQEVDSLKNKITKHEQQINERSSNEHYFNLYNAKIESLEKAIKKLEKLEHTIKK
jgi:hypothetical protein